jgi:hypothetical protein
MNLAGSNDAKARGAFPLIVLGTGLCSAVPMVEFLPRGVFDETALEASTDIKELAVDFGRGGHHEIVILVRNNSLSKPEQLIGFRRAGPGFCSVVGDQFPIDIRPGETRQIKMAIEYPTVPDNGESFIRDLIDKGLTDPINLADGLSLEFASSVPNSANTMVSIWVYPNASFRQRFNDIFAERFRVSGW